VIPSKVVPVITSGSDDAPLMSEQKAPKMRCAAAWCLSTD